MGAWGSWPYLIENGMHHLAVIFSALGVSLQCGLFCGCVSFCSLSLADREVTGLAPGLREGFTENVTSGTRHYVTSNILQHVLTSYADCRPEL